MLYMSINFGMEVGIQIHNDSDEVVYTKQVFFPELMDELAVIISQFGTKDFRIIALHGVPQYTVKVLPLIQKAFPTALAIVDGGKNDPVSTKN